MSETWQTIEQAAVTLRLSVRTVNRHITAGKLQSRLNEGRREVLVTSESVPTEFPSDAPEVAAESASVDSQTVLALADNAAEKAELAVAAYQALARVADTQLQHVRRTARFAWAAVAVMAVGVTVAVGWASHKVTRTTDQIRHLESSLAGATEASQTMSVRHDAAVAERIEVERTLRGEMSDRERALATERASAEQSLRAQLAAAQEQAARADGALAAYKELARRADVSDVSDVSGERATAGDSAVLAKSIEPATRPITTRRKALSAQTRPAPLSDTSSASTAEED